MGKLTHKIPPTHRLSDSVEVRPRRQMDSHMATGDFQPIRIANTAAPNWTDSPPGQSAGRYLVATVPVGNGFQMARSRPARKRSAPGPVGDGVGTGGWGGADMLEQAHGNLREGKWRSLSPRIFPRCSPHPLGYGGKMAKK